MKPLIDVSYWQDPANINYQELAKHISGVIIHVGYTTTGTHAQRVDPHFETHYAKFKEYGVPVGAYYYSCATNLSVAEAEAEATIAFLKGKRFEYPIWYDMEEDQQRALPKSLLTDIAISYCEKLEGAGYYVGLYSWDSWFWEEMESDRLDPFDIWAARTAGEPRPGYVSTRLRAERSISRKIGGTNGRNNKHCLPGKRCRYRSLCAACHAIR